MWIKTRFLFIFLFFSPFFLLAESPEVLQKNDTTNPFFCERSKELPQSGTDLLGNLPSLSDLTQQALTEWKNLEQSTDKLSSKLADLEATLEKFGIPLNNLEQNLRQQTASLNNMKLSLEAMGERLQTANEDYAAEQEYHQKIERGYKIKTTALTIGLCVTGAAAIGLGVWALVK